MNEDYACTVFRSCRKVSIVAMADLQSSIAFLDFLGVSGQNTSMSIITFQFTPLNSSNSTPTTAAGINPLSALTLGMTPELQRKCGDINEEYAVTDIQEPINLASAASDTPAPASSQAPNQGKVSANQTGMPLSADAYPCYYKFKNNTLANYSKVVDPTCTFCAEVCEPPQVDDKIGFFDGFDQKTFYIVYGCMIGFSILYQIYVCAHRDKKAKEELEELKNEVLYKSYEHERKESRTPTNEMEEE